MRSEIEMFDLILGVAQNDERIRAVYMNGSRANPNVVKDIYQDYDIVYVVTETKSFLDNKDWISVFGSIAIVQEPDLNDFGFGIKMDFDRSYAWLMLFKDGNRIDLGVQTKEAMLEEYTSDKLTVPLLDKDNCLPKILLPTDEDYWVKKPTELQYTSCCNNFWWCLNNVAKGIARDQLPYAMWMYNVVVRDMLVKIIDWYIGINTNFAVSVGMSGKYYKKHLPSELYKMYTKTYSDSNYEHFWAAIFTACELFRTIAPPVAKHFGYTYNQSEDVNMTEYLNKVKSVSEIADSIACCGLVCMLCHFTDSCDGCRSENNCCGLRKTSEGWGRKMSKELSNGYNEKGIDGCWQCDIAPCDKGMFLDNHDVRLRAFIKYIKEESKDKLAERLYFNMQNGIYYGHGKDYDGLGSIDAVIKKVDAIESEE